MHIVGGLYRELCEIPYWDATLGSGARASLAAASLAHSTEFTTYASTSDRPALIALEARGITVNSASRPSPIVFAYFHPLSSPHLEPRREAIAPQAPLMVTGDAVMRFGFLEGDAIVTARRAVYDPQTWRNPQPFGANGSTAQELALVLNELEIQSFTGITNIAQAANHLIRSADAQVVVVKQGPYGASVFDAEGGCSHVPAYRSASVFKIGTGDVFSAIFAHHWAQMNMCASKAADLASRSVSVYCEARRMEFDHAVLASREPVSARRGASVRIEAAAQGIGQRYVLEEARLALSELGVRVGCPTLAEGISGDTFDATLVINGNLPSESMARIAQDITEGRAVVVLDEQRSTRLPASHAVLTVSDFTTSIYFAAWAAGEAVSTR
ncbi:PfkB family carbohydrate kinase [Pseudomonas abietaniphila]|uniref:PfkB family carbohydrate kinase n=1 Tax=Pseudomonas abietaniphila TaxID=89065 RepID=UPI000783CD9B|nr:PfkB family carbohydrate kinase [Pseudomonas abietaniphila]